MKKIFFGVVLSIFVGLSISALPAFASSQDFTFDSFHADYYLSRDQEGRSSLRTVETIVAKFPDFDQNHGIERQLVRKYDGHDVSLSVKSVQDASGRNWNYSSAINGNFLTLRIGDADKYVHGSVTYVITYVQRDVTKFFQDTNDDEFYWDVNGTGWSQSFGSVTAEVHLSGDLVDAISAGESCYYGAYGSNKACRIVFNDGSYRAEAKGLSAKENMSIVVAFKPNTFVGYPMTAKDYAENYVVLAYALAGLVVIMLVIFIRLKYCRDATSDKPIIPEYLPPKYNDIQTSSIVGRWPSKWIAAQYIDLAVRGNIKIIQEEKKLFRTQTYRLELTSSEKISLNEMSFLSAVFGSYTYVGNEYVLNPMKQDGVLGQKLMTTYRSAKRKAELDGFFRDIKKYKSLMMKMAIFYGLVGLVTMFVFPEKSQLAFGIALIVFAMSLTIALSAKPISEKGRTLANYLEGLRLYIKVAEKDRLSYLQSVAGSEKIDINDKEKLVKLYEKVLPYAVLFGMEKSWAKALGNLYDERSSSPSWYSGANGFNAVIFASSLSSFSRSTTMLSSVSSGSGGSGGGGFSGGGGGGGGGGGW